MLPTALLLNKNAYSISHSKVVSKLTAHSFNISKCFQGNIIELIPQSPVTSSCTKEAVGKLIQFKCSSFLHPASSLLLSWLQGNKIKFSHRPTDKVGYSMFLNCMKKNFLLLTRERTQKKNHSFCIHIHVDIVIKLIIKRF